MFILHSETELIDFSNLLNLISNDLEKNGNQITSENIHIYYKHMDTKMREEYKELIDSLLIKRKNIINGILFDAYYDNFKGDYKFVDIGRYRIEQTIFGIKDVLEPIDNYIEQIKESELYKIFTSECRCNNCMTYFESDDNLEDFEDEDGKFKGCPECKTDSYLMDLHV